MMKLILAVAGAYLLFLALVFLMQGRLVYFPGMPGRELTASPSDIGLAYEDVAIATEDGLRLHGWFVPAAGTERATLLFFHGNAGNISHRLESIRQFHELGLAMLIVDYRGYGRSEGRPSEEGTYRDAAAAWEYLTAERGVAASDVVVFGRSIGGSIAAWLAARRAPRALIVESSFASLTSLGQELYPFLPVRLLSRYRYPTAEYVAAADCPVLVIHSRADEIIPFRHGERIYEAAGEPRMFLALDGPHNGAHVLDEARYLAGLEQFLGEYAGRRR